MGGWPLVSSSFLDSYVECLLSVFSFGMVPMPASPPSAILSPSSPLAIQIFIRPSCVRDRQSITDLRVKLSNIKVTHLKLIFPTIPHIHFHRIFVSLHPICSELGFFTLPTSLSTTLVFSMTAIHNRVRKNLKLLWITWKLRILSLSKENYWPGVFPPKKLSD